MVRLTNLADYAIVVMRDLALSDCRLNAGDLARHCGLPSPTVSKILGAMAKSGLLTSQRGLKGGFALARPAEAITVADIVEAVDGPIALVNCIDETASDCSIEQICVMRPHWHTINAAMRGALAEVTLAEIAAPPTFPDRPADAGEDSVRD